VATTTTCAVDGDCGGSGGTCISSQCYLYDFDTTGTLPKAGWNSAIVDDLSRGVHNPNFVFRVLNASIDAVNAYLAAP
jgi:hypothetical protein